MLTVEVKSSDLPRLVKQLRAAGSEPAVRRKLTKGLRDGTKPALSATRAAALALPAHGQKHTGLRKKMAAATGTQVRTSGKSPTVSVRTSRSRMGAQASLARATNDGSWRHPVFGNKNKYVTQFSRKGWFDNANRYTAPYVRRAVQGVLDQTEREMSHS